MKGLLIKDLKLLKNQKQFFLACIFICAIFGMAFDNPSFIICYITLMCSIFTVSTMAYDSQNNGMSYLFTLPVSRKGYVKEKYLFGILTSFCAVLVMAPCCAVIFLLRHIGIESGEIGSTALVSFGLALLIQAVMIPIQLKFEAEKSRTAMLVAMGAAYLIAFLLIKIVRKYQTEISVVLDRIAAAGQPVLAAAGCIAVIVLEGISFVISLQIIKKKEF